MAACAIFAVVTISIPAPPRGATLGYKLVLVPD